MLARYIIYGVDSIEELADGTDSMEPIIYGISFRFARPRESGAMKL